MFVTQPPEEYIWSEVPLYSVSSVRDWLADGSNCDDDEEYHNDTGRLETRKIHWQTKGELTLGHVIDDVNKKTFKRGNDSMLLWARGRLDLRGSIMEYSDVVRRAAKSLDFNFDE